MATSDKFLESMVELLDKMIENQSKNAAIMSEMKSSLSELRSETSSILTNIKEKLPTVISQEQEENYHKLLQLINKMEDNSVRLSDNIKTFEKDYQITKVIIERSEQEILSNKEKLDEIVKLISEKNEQKEKTESVLNDIKGFIDGLKSKKAWVALVVAGIAALATMLSAIVGGINSINHFLDDNKPAVTAPASSPTNPTTPPATKKSP